MKFKTNSPLNLLTGLMMLCALIGNISIAISILSSIAWFITWLLERPTLFVPEASVIGLGVAITGWVLAFLFMHIEVKSWF